MSCLIRINLQFKGLVLRNAEFIWTQRLMFYLSVPLIGPMKMFKNTRCNRSTNVVYDPVHYNIMKYVGTSKNFTKTTTLFLFILYNSL